MSKTYRLLVCSGTSRQFRAGCSGRMNEFAQRLRQRSIVLRTIREFFHVRNYTELDPGCLTLNPSIEPYIDSFSTVGLHLDAFLRTSPEYSIKKAIGLGARDVYTLGPCFRDEPESNEHAHEFTMLEWYSDGASLFELMSQTEELIRKLWSVLGQPKILRDQHLIDLESPFEIKTISEVFLEHAGVCPIKNQCYETLRAVARDANLRFSESIDNYDDLFFQLMLNYVEPNIGRPHPIFLWGYPRSQAALARLDPEQSDRALRFELYAGGLELANAFDELRCAQTQRIRFLNEQSIRKTLNKPVFPIDEDLLAAIDTLPQTAGIALGVDRLLMLLLNENAIKRVRLC